MVELVKKKKKKSKQHGLNENGTSPTKTEMKVEASEVNVNKDLVDEAEKKVEQKQNHELGINIKQMKKRLEIESDYIEELLSLVKLPASLLVDREQENEHVTVDFRVSKEDRPDLFGKPENRAQTDIEIRERFQKKIGEIQSKNNRKEKKKKEKGVKVTKQMKRAAKKKEKREALKKTLTKATQGKGNLKKGNLGSQFEGVVTKGAGGEDDKQNQNIVFSKFDFVEPIKGLRAPVKNNDPKAALEKIKKSKEKLRTMKEKGLTEKVENIESKMAWKKAMDKAEGVKVKDDVELLKKSIRRKESEKRKGAKLWKDQAEKVASKKEEKQKKRAANIKKRKTDKKEHRKKLMIKKGRFIPGMD